MKKHTKTKLIIGSIFAILLISGAIFLFSYLSSVNSYQAEVKSMAFSEIDLKSIPDGRYTGECDVDFIYAKVEVIVENGNIENINLLEHNHEKGIKAEKIIEDILEKQSVDVDTIATATNSSKVIKKAVENALLYH